MKGAKMDPLMRDKALYGPAPRQTNTIHFLQEAFCNSSHLHVYHTTIHGQEGMPFRVHYYVT
jgi:hypothetical protein